MRNFHSLTPQVIQMNDPVNEESKGKFSKTNIKVLYNEKYLTLRIMF